MTDIEELKEWLKENIEYLSKSGDSYDDYTFGLLTAYRNTLSILEEDDFNPSGPYWECCMRGCPFMTKNEECCFAMLGEGNTLANELIECPLKNAEVKKPRNSTKKVGYKYKEVY